MVFIEIFPLSTQNAVKSVVMWYNEIKAKGILTKVMVKEASTVSTVTDGGLMSFWLLNRVDSSQGVVVTLRADS